MSKTQQMGVFQRPVKGGFERGGMQAGISEDNRGLGETSGFGFQVSAGGHARIRETFFC